MVRNQTLFGPQKTSKSLKEDGTIYYSSDQPLDHYPEKITQKLGVWASKTPDKIFLAQRNQQGDWEYVSYKNTLQKVRSIAQYLLNQHISYDETIVILSENSIEHGLLALAAMYIGIPYSPVSPAYSLISDDFLKLGHCLKAMTPKIIFVQNPDKYHKAIQFAKTLFPLAIVISANNINTLVHHEDSVQLDNAYSNVHKDTIVKVLFTSGSTGLPKGVINTQGMWCANLQQITQAFPFLKEEPPVLVDWLPWNHTFGGNHNFGLALYHGGTLYIDDGIPSTEGIEKTADNLREISPTAYFNVPKGFEMLIPYFEKDETLRKSFFKNLHILFYAGASLSQSVWNKWEELAIQSIGQKIPFVTGLGCTESGPSALFANRLNSFSGLLGIPVAGLNIKLSPFGDKKEVRYKGPNITPGYWRNQDATCKTIDEEGYYKTGDSVKFLDDADPDQGLVFDGRIAEDFKLNSGTWVNVGVLKSKLITACAPIVQDLILAGLNKEYIGAILFLNMKACKSIVPEDINDSSPSNIFYHPAIINYLERVLELFNENAKGSSTRIQHAIIAVESPSIESGEITDKGSLNQNAILQQRTQLVEKLFDQTMKHSRIII